MFCQSTKALGLLIFTAEATMICESPHATRCRSWSCPVRAFVKKRFCTNVMSSVEAGAGKVETGAANCSLRKAGIPIDCRCESDAGLAPQVDCSSKRPAAEALKPLAGLPTSNANALEVFEPGSGLITVTCTVPAWDAVPVAVSSVEETKVVVRNAPPNDTTAPFANCLPLTTTVKLPTGIVVGRTAVTTGAGLVIVAVPVEEAVVSARLVAVT